MVLKAEKQNDALPDAKPAPSIHQSKQLPFV